jgi:CheY-like chemotaxis protein
MERHLSLSRLQPIDCFPKALAIQPTSYVLQPGYTPQGKGSFADKSSPGQAKRKPLALVVDDAPDLAEMLSVFLTHAGYDVVTANSAKAALDAAERARFDVVISDIGMPRMNGYQLVQTLRGLPGYSSIPMIAVTGFSMYDDRERSLSSGFNAHVTKPIDPIGLFELIEQLRG